MDIYDPESPTEDDGLEDPLPKPEVRPENEFEFDLADVPLPPGAAPTPVPVPLWNADNAVGRSKKKKKKKKKKKNKDGSTKQGYEEEEMCEDPLFGYPPPLPPAPPPLPPPPCMPPPLLCVPPPPPCVPMLPPLTAFTFTSAASPPVAGFTASSLVAGSSGPVSSHASPILPVLATSPTFSLSISSSGTPLINSSQEKQHSVEGEEAEETKDEPVSLAKQLLNKALGGVCGRGDRSSPSRDDEATNNSTSSPLAAGKLKFSLKPAGSATLQKVSFQIKTKKAAIKTADGDHEEEIVSSVPPSVTEPAVMPVRFKKSKPELFRPDLKVGEEMDIADLLMQEQMRIASQSLVAMQAAALLEKSRQAAAEKELARKRSPDVNMRSPESKTRKGEKKDRRSTRDDKREESRAFSERGRKDGREKAVSYDEPRDKKERQERSLGSEEEKQRSSKDNEKDEIILHSDEDKLQRQKDSMSRGKEQNEVMASKFDLQSEEGTHSPTHVTSAEKDNILDISALSLEIKENKVDCEERVIETLGKRLDLSLNTFSGNEESHFTDEMISVPAGEQKSHDVEVFSQEKLCMISLNKEVKEKYFPPTDQLAEKLVTPQYLQTSKILIKAPSSKELCEVKIDGACNQEKEELYTDKEKHNNVSLDQQIRNKADFYRSRTVGKEHDSEMFTTGESNSNQSEEEKTGADDKSHIESQSSVDSTKKDFGRRSESYKRVGSKERESAKTRNRSRSGSREKTLSRRQRMRQRSRSDSRDKDRTKKFGGRRESREREERRRRNRSRSDSREKERSSRRRKSRSNSHDKDKSKKKEERSFHPSRDRERDRAREKHKNEHIDFNIKESRELHIETRENRSKTGFAEIHSVLMTLGDNKQALKSEEGYLEKSKVASADSEKNKSKNSSREDVDERKQKTESSSPDREVKKASKDRNSCKTSYQSIDSQSPSQSERFYRREWQLDSTVHSDKISKHQSRSPEGFPRRNRRRRSSSSDGNERPSGRFRSRSRSVSHERRLARQHRGSDNEEEFLRRRALDWSRDQAHLRYKRRKRSDSSEDEKASGRLHIEPETQKSVKVLSKDQEPPTKSQSSIKPDNEAIMEFDLADILLPGEIPAEQTQAKHAEEQKEGELLLDDQGEKDMDLDESFSDGSEPYFDLPRVDHIKSGDAEKMSFPVQKVTVKGHHEDGDDLKTQKPPEKIQFSLKTSGRCLKLKPRKPIEDLDDEDTRGKGARLFLPQELDRMEERLTVEVHQEKTHFGLNFNIAEEELLKTESDLKFPDSTNINDDADESTDISKIKMIDDNGTFVVKKNNGVDDVREHIYSVLSSESMCQDSSSSSVVEKDLEGHKTAEEEDKDDISQESFDCEDVKTGNSSPEKTKVRGRLFKYEPLWELDKKERKPPLHHPVIVPGTSGSPLNDITKPTLPVSLGLDYGSSSEGEDSESSPKKILLPKGTRQNRKDRSECGPENTSCHRSCAQTIAQTNSPNNGLPKLDTPEISCLGGDDEAGAVGFITNIQRLSEDDVESSLKGTVFRNEFQSNQETTRPQKSSERSSEIVSTEISLEINFQKRSCTSPGKTSSQKTFDVSIEKPSTQRSLKTIEEKRISDEIPEISLERAGSPKSCLSNRDRKSTRVRKSRFSDRSPPRSMEKTVDFVSKGLPSHSLQENQKSDFEVKENVVSLRSFRSSLSQENTLHCTGDEKFTGINKTSKFAEVIDGQQKVKVQGMADEWIEGQNTAKRLTDPLVKGEQLDNPSKLSGSHNVDRGRKMTAEADDVGQKFFLEEHENNASLKAEKVSTCASIEHSSENAGSQHFSSVTHSLPVELARSGFAKCQGYPEEIVQKLYLEPLDRKCLSPVKTAASSLSSIPIPKEKPKYINPCVFQDPEISTATEEPVKESGANKKETNESCEKTKDRSLAFPSVSENALSTDQEESDKAFRSVQLAVLIAQRNMESSDSQSTLIGDKTFAERGKMEQQRYSSSRQVVSGAAELTSLSHSSEVVSSAAESTTDIGGHKQHETVKNREAHSKTFSRQLIPEETVTSVKSSVHKNCEPVFDSRGSIVKAGKIQIIIGKKVASVSGHLTTESQKHDTEPEPVQGFPVQVITRKREDGPPSELIWPECRAVAAVEETGTDKERESSSLDTSSSEEESEKEEREDLHGSGDERIRSSFDSHRRESSSKYGFGDRRHHEFSNDDNRSRRRRDSGDDKERRRGSDERNRRQSDDDRRRRDRDREWVEGRQREREDEDRRKRDRERERERDRERRERERMREEEKRRRISHHQSSTERSYQRSYDKNRRRSQSPAWRRGRSREHSRERANSTERSYQRNHERRRSRSRSPEWRRARSRELSQERPSDRGRDKSQENRDRRDRRDSRERNRRESRDRGISDSGGERLRGWSRDRSSDFSQSRTRDDSCEKVCDDSVEKSNDYALQDHSRHRSHDYVRSRVRESSLDKTDYDSERMHSQERMADRSSNRGRDYNQDVPWKRGERILDDIDPRTSDYNNERLERSRDQSRSRSREREPRVSDQKWEIETKNSFSIVSTEVQAYSQSIGAVQPAVLTAPAPFYPPEPVYPVPQEGNIAGLLIKPNQGYEVYPKTYPDQQPAVWTAPPPTTIDISSLHVVQQHYQTLGYPADQSLALAHQYVAGDPAAQIAYTQTYTHSSSAYTLDPNQSTYPYVSGNPAYVPTYPTGVPPVEYGHDLSPAGNYAQLHHHAYSSETFSQGYPEGAVVPSTEFSYESVAEMEAHLQAEMHPDPREAALFGDLPSFRRPRNCKKPKVPLLPTPTHVLPKLQTDKKKETADDQSYKADSAISTVVSTEPDFATSSLAEPTFETSHLGEDVPVIIGSQSCTVRDAGDERIEKDNDEVVSSTNPSSNDSYDSANQFSGSESKPMKVKSRWRRSSEAEAVVEATSSCMLLESVSKQLVHEPRELVVQAAGKEIGGDQDFDSLPPPPPPQKRMRTDTMEQLQDKTATDAYPVFEVITENIHLTQRKKSKSMKRMVCDCTTSKSDRAMGIPGCGSDCLNRMLMIECGSRCPCLDYCTNKRFQKKQYSKTQAFNAGVGKGWGLQALEDLTEKGAFVMEYVGELLDYKEFVRRTRQYAKQGLKHHYFMALNADEVIDATLRGSISRFMNHSCDPNCETQKWTVNGELRVGFFTKKPVKAGEELTFDYQFEFYGEPQKCFCGAEKCRGFIGGQKISPVKKRKDKTAEKRKMELFEDEMLDEDIQHMCQLKEGMRNKKHVLEVCRLMVRAEKQEHRLAILQIIQDTTEMNCLSLFLGYHGLPLLWSWMMDIGSGDSEEDKLLKRQVLQVLSMLPISNKTILKESKIMPIVEKWAQLSHPPPPPPPEQEADSVCEPLPLPVPPNKPVISILACSKEYKEPKTGKKRVTFADEATSSDSDLSDTLKISSTSANGDQSGDSSVSTSSLPTISESSANEDGKNDEKTEVVSSLEGDSLPSSATSSDPEDPKLKEVYSAESAMVTTEADKEKVEAPVTRRRSGRRSQTPLGEAKESEGRVLRSSKRKSRESEEGSEVVDSTSQRQELGKTEAKAESEGVLESAGSSAEADASSTSKESTIKAGEDLPHVPSADLHPQENGDSLDSTAHPDSLAVSTDSQSVDSDSSSNQVEAQDNQSAETEGVVSSGTYGVDESGDRCEGLAPSFEDTESSEDAMCGYKNIQFGQSSENEGKAASDIDPVEFESVDEITMLAVNLLHGWNELKELYKIPKKQRVEERKRTERELESVVFKEPEKREMDPYAKWKRKKAVKPRKKDLEEEELRKRNLVLVGPRMSKEERRQLFEAQVKAEDEMAEMQRQQEAIQQHQQEAAFFLHQNPAFVSVLHGLAAGDPNLVGAHGQVLDPSLLYGAGVLTPEQQQAATAFAGLLNAPGMSGDAVTAAQQLLAHHNLYPLEQYQVSGVYPQPPAPTVFPDASVLQQQQQQLTLHQLMSTQAIQQMVQRQQPFPAASDTQAVEEDDVPPPPSPPKSKELALPPNWKTARDGEGRLYYYHTVTRQTQWDPPSWESNSPEDMDFDLPDPELELDEKSKKKTTTTAAADTSSEVAKKIKDQFRRQMSQFVVLYLNPYRKPDCKVGRITSTEEFKHLARKLTHHVMAKELKHCRHVEDLEVNENVKAKAKDYVRKYMSRFGSLYKKTMSPQPDDLLL